MSAAPVTAVDTRGQDLSRRLAPLVFITVLLAIWQAAGMSGALPVYILSPGQIITGVADYTASGDLWPDLSASLRRAALGFILGAGLGTGLGLASGTFRDLGDLVELPMAFTYPLPKIALFPVLAVLLGFTDTTRIIIIALACFYPTFLNAQSGTRAVNPTMLELARNVEASRWQTFRHVVVPAALPRTLAGLRIAVGLSFILLFATEIIGFSDGIGATAWQEYGQGDYSRMYAAIAVLAASGFVAYQLYNIAARSVLAGRGDGRA